MKFLPIVERELRVASRRSGTYWVRISAALVALLIGGWMLLVITDFRTTKAAGTAMFMALSMFAMIYSILAGLRTTSDCLSEEKREGTLGLLFLTDLKGYDIVLGKLFATSLNAFYGLLAIFPVLAIPILLGGVSAQELVRVIMCCLNSLFFSLSAGMFCSAISKDERKSLVGTFFVLLFFVGALPALGGLLTLFPQISKPPAGFYILSPGFQCITAFDQAFNVLPRATYNPFYASLTSVHLVSWVLMGLACFIVPRTWQDGAATPGKMRRQKFLARLRHGPPQSRASTRARLLDLNPIYWLTARDRIKNVMAWSVLGLAGLIWLWGLLTYRRDWLDVIAYIITALIIHTIFKYRITLEAAHRLGLDRQSGAMELLLSTPLTVRQVVLGYLRGLARQFFWPSMCVLLMDFVFLMAGRTNGEWVFTMGTGMVVFAADMVALSLLSMWKSFTTGQPNRGAISSIILLLCVPWAVFIILITMLMFSGSIGQRLLRGNELYFMIALWGIIALVFDLTAGLWSWHHLMTRLRSLSSQPAKTKGHPPATPTVTP